MTSRLEANQTPLRAEQTAEKRGHAKSGVHNHDFSRAFHPPTDIREPQTKLGDSGWIEQNLIEVTRFAMLINGLHCRTSAGHQNAESSVFLQGQIEVDPLAEKRKSSRDRT